MNCPPCCRAKSQLNSAVRTPPMCRYPVGLGAKRVRTMDVGWWGLSRFSCQRPFPGVEGDSPIFADQRRPTLRVGARSVPAKIGTVPKTGPEEPILHLKSAIRHPNSLGVKGDSPIFADQRRPTLRVGARENQDRPPLISPLALLAFTQQSLFQGLSLAFGELAIDGGGQRVWGGGRKRRGRGGRGCRPVCRLRRDMRRVYLHPSVAGGRHRSCRGDSFLSRLVVQQRILPWQKPFGVEDHLPGVQGHCGQQHQAARHFGARAEHHFDLRRLGRKTRPNDQP